MLDAVSYLWQLFLLAVVTAALLLFTGAFALGELALFATNFCPFCICAGVWGFVAFVLVLARAQSHSR